MPILKELKKHKLLLDTHIWIWSINGDKKLSKSFQAAFERASTTQGILLSPISIWELGMLVEKKRLEIDMDVLDWVEQALDIPGLGLSSITPRIAIHSTRLTGDIQGDPVDRLLIATAMEEGAVLITCDRKILSFAEGKFLTAHNPCAS